VKVFYGDYAHLRADYRTGLMPALDQQTSGHQDGWTGHHKTQWCRKYPLKIMGTYNYIMLKNITERKAEYNQTIMLKNYN